MTKCSSSLKPTILEQLGRLTSYSFNQSCELSFLQQGQVLRIQQKDIVSVRITFFVSFSGLFPYFLGLIPKPTAPNGPSHLFSLLWWERHLLAATWRGTLLSLTVHAPPAVLTPSVGLTPCTASQKLGRPNKDGSRASRPAQPAPSQGFWEAVKVSSEGQYFFMSVFNPQWSFQSTIRAGRCVLLYIIFSLKNPGFLN